MTQPVVHHTDQQFYTYLHLASPKFQQDQPKDGPIYSTPVYEWFSTKHDYQVQNSEARVP